MCGQIATLPVLEKCRLTLCNTLKPLEGMEQMPPVETLVLALDPSGNSDVQIDHDLLELRASEAGVVVYPSPGVRGYFIRHVLYGLLYKPVQFP